jgi:hypothetical protein
MFDPERGPLLTARWRGEATNGRHVSKHTTTSNAECRRRNFQPAQKGARSCAPSGIFRCVFNQLYGYSRIGKFSRYILITLTDCWQLVWNAKAYVRSISICERRCTNRNGDSLSPAMKRHSPVASLGRSAHRLIATEPQRHARRQHGQRVTKINHRVQTAAEKIGVLIGLAQQLPESESDQYRFWEFAKSRNPSQCLPRLRDRPSEGPTIYGVTFPKYARRVRGFLTLGWTL